MNLEQALTIINSLKEDKGIKMEEDDLDLQQALAVISNLRFECNREKNLNETAKFLRVLDQELYSINLYLNRLAENLNG